jgi:hypothetical protein
MNALTSYEAPEADEEDLTRKITDILRRKMERDHPAGATKRDAHPKHVALVSAKFIVEPELPANLAVGVFATPKTYDAWVRLSNANGEPRSDAVKDIRGCAVKLLDVEGARIPESDEATTQDFLMVSMPTMPLGNVTLFHDAIYYSIESSRLLFLAKMVLNGKFGMLATLSGAKTHPTSPVDIRYWSTTPYLLGSDQVVKYSVVPTSTRRSAMPGTPSDTYLSDNLQAHLADGDATFDFKVQLRTNAGEMPVEDAEVEWPETQSPFVKVATLVIPKQTFRSAERDSLAEALAFSPAHALAAHRPLGSINRARMKIYQSLSQFRQQRDQRKRVP